MYGGVRFLGYAWNDKSFNFRNSSSALICARMIIMAETGRLQERGESSKPSETQERRGVVKDSWFNAFVRGNSMWPQATFGIAILTTAAVLRDPPERWEDFSGTRLSTEQISKLGTAMTSHHRKADIPHALANSAKDGELPVQPSRLQEVWKGLGVAAVTRTLGNYLESPYIWSFLGNPQNDKDIQRLKKIIYATEEVLTSDEGKELAANYRNSFKKTPPDQLQKTEESQDRNEKTPFDIALKRIRESAQEKLPEENLRWLLGRT